MHLVSISLLFGVFGVRLICIYIVTFLAPTGAHGVTMSVRLSVRHNMLKSSLELSIFIFLQGVPKKLGSLEKYP